MGFALGQADKKMEEAFHMPNWTSARRDLLGALVYVSAAILYGDEINQKDADMYEEATERVQDTDDPLEEDYDDDSEAYAEENFEEVTPPMPEEA